MKANDIISAADLTALIKKHGTGTVSFDGSMPEEYLKAEDLGLEEGDTFRVVLNYGYEVQFHPVSDKMRAIITTGLKGRCDPVMGWMA